MENKDNVDQIADDDEASDKHYRWLSEIRLYEKEAAAWERKGKTILKRYKDERNAYDSKKSQYNILWSNVQTLQPALYCRTPHPDIERRYKQKDDLGRISSDILERATSYFVHTNEFDRVMRSVVLDRLLPGRGTAWVRYMPYFEDAAIDGTSEEEKDGYEITDDSYAEDDEDRLQEISFEKVCIDYVHWQDFGHNIARTEDEVTAKWRRVYMTKQRLEERFPEYADDIPLDYSPKKINDEKISSDLKKATIYEIWDKETKTVLWLHKDFDKILDEKDDPLDLEDFFPCPVSLLSTTANDSLIPVPDYVQYQDQARELDDLTGRIHSITKALKVCGVYAADAEAISRLLAEGVENQLVPVDQWMMFAEKGGLKGVFELFPVSEIAQTLLSIYDARDKVKQDLYEVTGIADIIRGVSNPNDTATAQQIKGQFANIRLQYPGQDVQRFAADLVRITAQIIAKHFQIDTIKKISGVTLLTNQEKMIIQHAQAMQQMQAQQAQMQAQQPPQGQPPMGQPRPPMPQGQLQPPQQLPMGHP